MKTVYKDYPVRYFLCFLTMAACSLVSMAQDHTGPGSVEPEGTIRLKSSVSTTEITIGDRFTYDLTLVYSEGIQVTAPSAGENLGDFEIKDFQIQEPSRNKEGLMEQRFKFLLSTFTTGEYVIPPVTVSYVDAAGRKAELQSQPMTVKVLSVLPEDAEDIKDIKKTTDIKTDYRNLYILIGSIGLLLAAVLAFIIWLKRRKRRREEPAPEEKLPPHLRAFLDLDDLCREKLLEAGEFKAFYVRFAEIFLAYLTGRFRVRTFERTTTEILEDMEDLSPDESIPARVGDILDECGLVKFAKYIPSLLCAENTLEKARSFIRDTAEKNIPKEPEAENRRGQVEEEPAVVESTPERGAL